MAQPSTADYRKYPKGPNFLLIVILSGLALVIFMLVAYFLVRGDGRRVIPLKHVQKAVSADSFDA